ncbi:MAG: hypothetical protein Q7T80_16580 [Methanoregula sp.]|nr:hypothetical protein [Methanoregula sp.]
MFTPLAGIPPHEKVLKRMHSREQIDNTDPYSASLDTLKRV